MLALVAAHKVGLVAPNRSIAGDHALLGQSRLSRGTADTSRRKAALTELLLRSTPCSLGALLSHGPPLSPCGVLKPDGDQGAYKNRCDKPVHDCASLNMFPNFNVDRRIE
jgi:hypothetical protein